MKKIIRFLLLFIIVILSGCLNYTQEVSLNTDGSGTMKIHYWMKIPQSGQLEMIDQLGIFNKDSINAQFTSPYSALEDVEVYADTLDSTYHAKIELTFVHIDSLRLTKPFSDAQFSLKDGAAGQKIFSQFIAPIATGFGLDGSEFSVTYIYNFPGEIITHNAPIVEKKNLIWKYNLSELGKGKTISVTYRPFKLKETPLWIYILSGLVLSIVIFFLFKKRRN